jgi:Zn-finger nucleic acid-binding protein
MARSLQCCPGCSRQHDVSALSLEQSIHCSCNTSFPVAAKRALAPRALCCSRCGGNLRDHARSCEYCEAEVTLEERRLDSICPACFGRMSSDANFCMSCGVKILAQTVAALPAKSACPRCKAELRTRQVGANTLVECGSCAGLWVEPQLLERLCSDVSARKSIAEVLGKLAVPKPQTRALAEGYIPCPNCKEPMNRKNFGSISGVLIDVCREHGVWLDHGELERALSFAETGGLIEARRREVTELERRKQRAQSDAPTTGGAWMDIEPSKTWGGMRRSRMSRSPVGGLLGWLADELLG